jgi:diketogulonate reductase-like aldo/keto reductase
MNIPTKKLKNGFEMPVFGLGTWQMGGRETRDPQNDDKKDITAIQKAISLGIKLIDTAESYANGYAETLIGKAMKGYDRSKLFIVSKIHRDHLGYDDVLQSCESSLKRLQTPYLDLYLIHAPNDTIPIAETLRGMDTLIQNGIVKNIGVSNFRTNRLKKAQTLTQNKLVINQVYYNLVIREPEGEGLLDYCQQNDVLLQAYRPLEKGMLLAQSSAILNDLAKKYEKTPAQIAINWLISQINVITISKTSTIDHLEENLGSIGWNIDDKDIEYLRKNFPNQKEKSEMLPLR